MFCIKCGKPAVAGNFCESCFLERNELFEIKNFRLTVCSVCGSHYSFEKGWHKSSAENEILWRVKTKNRGTGQKIALKNVGNKLLATVQMTGFISPLKKMKTETVSAEIVLRKQKCDNCIKISGGYYEAMFQIRGMKKEEILKSIKNEGVLSVENRDNGYNVKFIKKQDAKRIAKNLKDVYNVKGTFKLVGEKKGKRLYRSFYSIS